MRNEKRRINSILLCSLFIVLCSLLLACPSPFSPSNTGDPWEDPQIDPPLGKGSFTLSIRMSSTARTVLPKTPALSDFDKFTFVFTPSSNGSSLTENRSYAQLSAPFYLNPGTYTLEVSAFYTENRLVAKGGISGILINPGKSTNGELTLKVITDTGPGTFAYDVSFSLEGMELVEEETAIMESATMKITSQKTGVPTPDVVDLLTNGKGEITLDNGYYNVAFAFSLKVKEGETIHQTLALDWWEILHIYPHLESSFEQVFTIDYFYIDAYKVTFVCDNGGNDIIQSVLHGDTVKKLETDPTKTLCYFEDWYTGPNGSGTLFDFDKPIDKNTNIYAKWTTITSPLTNVNYIKPYLSAQSGGELTNPIELAFNLNLGTMTQDTSNWQQMLIKLDEVNKFVNLDLSLCAMDGNVFNPDSSVDTGKDLIVEITLPTAAQSIAAGISTEEPAFKNFNNLKSFSGGTGLTSIGNYAFYGCTSLTQNSLPNGITYIGSYAFRECTNLALTSLPNGITTINENTFYGCTKLALNSLPTNVTSIGASAFQDCTSLNLNTLPTGLISVGNNTFYNCTSLALNTLPAGLTTIGNGAFQGCTKLALTSLPAGITTISDYTFSGCTSLKVTSLPEGVTTIGASAFSGCTSITNFTLHTDITNIGNNAFSGCTKLTTVTSWKTTPPPTAGTTIFDGVPLTNFRIEVLADYVNIYRNAPGWNTYQNYIFSIGDGSSAYPFRIYTKQDLQKVGKDEDGNGWNLSSYYLLMDDINMTSESWTPIGTFTLQQIATNDFTTTFSGNFDGNSRNITGLTITASEDFQGMFGAVVGVVSNLALIDCDITGASYVGGVTGGNGGTVENCYTTGSIKGTANVIDDGCIGGVVGYNLGGTVKNCYTTCNVIGFDYVGGIVGINTGTVENCYATGDVSGNQWIGGVVGSNEPDEGTVENCYATGMVSGYDFIGGVVGYHTGKIVENCVGLNKQISITETNMPYYGRVVGRIYNGDNENNYGRSDMLLDDDSWIDTTYGEDGINIPSNTYTNTIYNPTWWTGTVKWSNTDWDIGINHLPRLWNMPAGDQNPALVP